MSDFSRAQNDAFDLARTLMVPVTLFEIDGQIGVIPLRGRRAACADAHAREASPRACPADMHIANRALARFHLRGLGAAIQKSQENERK